MKYPVLFCILLLPFSMSSQIITTWAGVGHIGTFTNPVNSCFDLNGNFYVADQVGHTVFKVDTSCIAVAFAGTGAAGYNGDTILATTAQLKQPVAVIADSIGNIFIADGINHRVRKVDHISNIITTIAGTGVPGFSGDNGLATNAELYAVADICFDKFGNLFIADFVNHRVRKVSTSGIITTVAGTGVSGYSGDGGLADTSKIAGPTGICTDTFGNLYIASESLYRVFKVSTSGFITTIAGKSSGWTYIGDNIPATSSQISPNKVKFNNGGILFITDDGNHRVYKVDPVGIIHLVAGNGVAGYSGDNGVADSAALMQPGGLSFDLCGNLYVCQTNPGPARIRKIAFYPTCNDTPCHAAIDTTTSMNNISSASPTSIYPNPAQNSLTVTSPNKMYSIAIINTVCRVLFKKETISNKTELDISAFSPGIYFIELINDKGEKQVRKIIKE